MKARKIINEAEKIIEKSKPKFWEVIGLLDSLEIKNCCKKADIEKNVFVKGVLFADSGALIKSGTYIEGIAYIGKNSLIGPNAYLRGNTIIAEECKISNSEIKNSILLQGAKVPHFSYIGDSIIGKKVNMGAGSKIANLRMDSANVKVDFFGDKVDSGRRKLGALIKDKTSIGVNAVINCGVIIGKNCIVYPGTFVRKSAKDGEIIF
ncbi:MAG: DapH/DapD/GlmU-related protein [Candidatus Diapherotrites archaeon]